MIVRGGPEWKSHNPPPLKICIENELNKGQNCKCTRTLRKQVHQKRKVFLDFERNVHIFRNSLILPYLLSSIILVISVPDEFQVPNRIV